MVKKITAFFFPRIRWEGVLKVACVCIHGSANALNEAHSGIFYPPQRLLIVFAVDSCVMMVLEFRNEKTSGNIPLDPARGCCPTSTLHLCYEHTRKSDIAQGRGKGTGIRTKSGPKHFQIRPRMYFNVKVTGLFLCLPFADVEIPYSRLVVFNLG
jgi:hypothetical protein